MSRESSSGCVTSTPNRTEAGNKSPWPERDAELLSLAALQGTDIAARMGLSLGQINGRLGRLKRLGMKIDRPPTRQGTGGPGRRPSPDGTSPEWPAERVLWLRALYPNGMVSRPEIASRLNTTVGAIGRKAHSLGLYRPSGASTRPPPNPSTPIRSPGRLTPLALNRPLNAEPRPPVVRAPLPPKYGRVTECCWPIGEPGTRDFRFCDIPSLPGRPYCEDHAKAAYTVICGHAEPQAGTGAVLAGAVP